MSAVVHMELSHAVFLSLKTCQSCFADLARRDFRMYFGTRKLSMLSAWAPATLKLSSHGLCMYSSTASDTLTYALLVDCLSQSKVTNSMFH